MPYRPHRLEANYPVPEVVTTTSPAPRVVVECWCLMVERMGRVRLDKFTRETWKKFDAKDLEEAPDAPKPRHRPPGDSSAWWQFRL